MPDKPAAVPSAAPSPGFLERMFGTTPMTPAMQQGIDIARKENPNLAPVQSYGPLSRLLQPQAQAYVNPSGGTIYMNPAQMGNLSPQEVADTLTHEQTHIMQNQNSPYGPTMSFLRAALGMNPDAKLPYGQQPKEMEAFQNERNRAYSQGRIGSPYPSFTNPGQYNYPQADIQLPAESRRVAPSPAMMRPVTMR